MINEFTEKGFVIEVPTNTCASGHSLMIKIETAHAKQNVKMTATCKVLEVIKIDKDVSRIVVELFQYEEREWSDLQNIYSSRQTEVMELFKTIKGY